MLGGLTPLRVELVSHHLNANRLENANHRMVDSCSSLNPNKKNVLYGSIIFRIVATRGCHTGDTVLGKSFAPCY